MRQINKPPTLGSFTAGKLKSVLIGQPDDLGSICDLLNGKKPQELCSELRKLVDAWQRSGPNLDKMLRDDTVLADRVRHGRTLLAPTHAGKGHLLWLPTPHGLDPNSWEGVALAHFMDLVVNPSWHKLGGPCQRCEKYYIKKTSRQKTYCSRRCGAMRTAIENTRRRRQEERVCKLRQAKESATRWATIRTPHPWKEWVSLQTKITVKWLTRAVNRGDLKAPVKD